MREGRLLGYGRIGYRVGESTAVVRLCDLFACEMRKLIVLILQP